MPTQEKSLEIYYLIIGIWHFLTNRRKWQVLTLFLLMLCNAIAEVFSLASIIPFLAVLTDPSQLWEIQNIRAIAEHLGIEEARNLMLPTTLLFIFVVTLAGVIRLRNVWLTNQMSSSIGTDLSCEAYKRTIYQPYKIHIDRNSSDIICSSTRHINITVSFLNATLHLANATLISTFLAAALFFIDWKIATAAIFLFSSCYLLIALITKNKLRMHGVIMEQTSNNQINIIQEGLGGIRDVLLDNSQSFYLEKYKRAVTPLRRSEANSRFLSLFPRYALEVIGLVLIALIAYLMTLEKTNNISIITALGAFALGAQRLLPAMQQIYSSWSTMRTGIASVGNVLRMLQQPLPKYKIDKEITPLNLNEKISIDKINFSYTDQSPNILKGIELEIYRGERIGIIGHTGSGKSTFMDILMGLLKPSEGRILVDNIDLHEKDNPERILQWQASIAHVPQNIYLSDNSIAENIAFGIPLEKIDMKRVISASREAKISNFIERSEKGYYTLVGERGVKLSGGQKQRIGIARALYKKAKLLVFDEATSALDNVTEKYIMESIKNLSKDLTIIIITHRIQTLKDCEKIIEINNSTLKIKDFKSQ